MESNRKSLLDNLGQEAQTFLNEGRQSEKKEKLKSEKTDFLTNLLKTWRLLCVFHVNFMKLSWMPAFSPRGKR